MKAILFEREAKGELVGAIACYDGKREGLGDDFLREIEQSVDRISARPRSFPKSSSRGHQKCLVERFPYTIHFIEGDDAIWVMAVAHHSRKPDYWIDREPG